MRHRPGVRPELHRIGHQAPPRALLAHSPARQLTLDDGVHLQTERVVAALAVWLAGEQASQVDQDGAWRVDPPEDSTDGLTAVPDGLEVTHCSIIRSNSAALSRVGMEARPPWRRRADPPVTPGAAG